MPIKSTAGLAFVSLILGCAAAQAENGGDAFCKAMQDATGACVIESGTTTSAPRCPYASADMLVAYMKIMKRGPKPELKREIGEAYEDWLSWSRTLPRESDESDEDYLERVDDVKSDVDESCADLRALD